MLSLAEILTNNITNIKTIELAIENKEGILSTNDDITHCSFVYRKTDNGINKVKSSSLDILYAKNIIDEMNENCTFYNNSIYIKIPKLDSGENLYFPFRTLNQNHQ